MESVIPVLYVLFLVFGLGLLIRLIWGLIRGVSGAASGISGAMGRKREADREEQIENARFLRDLERKTGIASEWQEDEQFAAQRRKRERQSR